MTLFNDSEFFDFQTMTIEPISFLKRRFRISEMHAFELAGLDSESLFLCEKLRKIDFTGQLFYTGLGGTVRRPTGAFKAIKASSGPCCTNLVGDSSRESSMIAGGHEQLGPYDIQDHKLVGLQRQPEATRIAVHLV